MCQPHVENETPDEVEGKGPRARHAARRLLGVSLVASFGAARAEGWREGEPCQGAARRDEAKALEALRAGRACATARVALAVHLTLTAAAAAVAGLGLGRGDPPLHSVLLREERRRHQEQREPAPRLPPVVCKRHAQEKNSRARSVKSRRKKGDLASLRALSPPRAWLRGAAVRKGSPSPAPSPF